MVWVSNQAGTCLNVSVSSAHTRGGATGFYAIEHELEAWHKNHWNRVANATETVVVQFKNHTLTVNDVQGNDLLLVYSDTYIRVPTAEQVHFT